MQGRAEASGLDPAAHWVARRIAATAGSRPVGRIRAETGLSDARLIALFRQQIGVTPKRYARIHRFARALALLSRPGASLSAAALGAGYYDQPHMNAEFRAMAGLTPRAVPCGEAVSQQHEPLRAGLSLPKFFSKTPAPAAIFRSQRLSHSTVSPGARAMPDIREVYPYLIVRGCGRRDRVLPRPCSARRRSSGCPTPRRGGSATPSSGSGR